MSSIFFSSTIYYLSLCCRISKTSFQNLILLLDSQDVNTMNQCHNKQLLQNLFLTLGNVIAQSGRRPLLLTLVQVSVSQVAVHRIWLLTVSQDVNNVIRISWCRRNPPLNPFAARMVAVHLSRICHKPEETTEIFVTK
jgi:hypothetical protein